MTELTVEQVKKAKSLDMEWNYIVVRPDKQRSETTGGLILSDFSKPPACSGKVIAGGPGHCSPESGVFVELLCAVGDRVIFSPWGGYELPMAGEDGKEEIFMVMQDTDLFAIIPKDDPTCDTTQIEFNTARRGH